MNPQFPAQGAPCVSPARCSRTAYISALLPSLFFSFFFPWFSLGGREWEVKAPLGDRAGRSHASAPAQDSQISRSRIRAEGPGRRAVCPGPGEPHLEGSGPPREPCRAVPSRTGPAGTQPEPGSARTGGTGSWDPFLTPAKKKK